MASNSSPLKFAAVDSNQLSLLVNQPLNVTLKEIVKYIIYAGHLHFMGVARLFLLIHSCWSIPYRFGILHTFQMNVQWPSIRYSWISIKTYFKPGFLVKLTYWTLDTLRTCAFSCLHHVYPWGLFYVLFTFPHIRSLVSTVYKHITYVHVTCTHIETRNKFYQ